MRHTSSLLRLIAVAFAILIVANRSSAQVVHFDVYLDPFQEVPPHNTPAYGSADLTLDVAAAKVSVDAGTGNYADLLAGATSVRIQDAAVGMNGPTIVSLTLDTPGNTTGTFSGSGTLTPTQITDMLAGNTYINIADSVFPSGELRGQIVPEPGSLALLAATSLLAMRRRPRA
jgi:hypothetical protein